MTLPGELTSSRRYGSAATLDGIPLITRGAVDLKAHPTLAAGDVKVSKDGGAFNNLTTLPTVTPAAGTSVRVSLSATEMQAARLAVVLHRPDHAQGMGRPGSSSSRRSGTRARRYQHDLNDGVRLGLTALPNAAAEAAGGLYTRGTGAGQINQDAAGRVDGNVVAWRGSVPDALSSGKVPADVQALARGGARGGDGERVPANACWRVGGPMTRRGRRPG